MRLMLYTCAVLCLAMLVVATPSGCSVPLPADLLGDLNINLNGNADGNANDNDAVGGADSVQLDAYASNTGGLSGMAIRPSDGALFGVNATGLFGPIEQGDDLAIMAPIGATNLADDALFQSPTSSLSLAITGTGEFWIGSPCCTRIAVVPPGGGDAVAFQGLFEVQDSKPEVIVRVPDGFTGEQMFPGQLLFGHETTFSRLVGVDVEGDRAVTNIDNPDVATKNRHAHYLAFGLDGVFYSSRTTTALTQSGFQTIATDGRPSDLPGTLGAAGDAFVALANGDLIIRGAFQMTATSSERGILLYDAEAETVTVGLAIPAADLSDTDDMLITADGSMILLSLPNRSEIVEVIVADEG